MTLVLELDLDMVKMYQHEKRRHPKVIAQTDRHTHRHTDSMKTLPSHIRIRQKCTLKMGKFLSGHRYFEWTDSGKGKMVM